MSTPSDSSSWSVSTNEPPRHHQRSFTPTPLQSPCRVADLVSDTSLWGITASAVFLVAYGAQRAVVDPVRVSDNGEAHSHGPLKSLSHTCPPPTTEEEDKELTTVSRKMALLFPLAASVSLLTTYLLWTHIQMLLTLLYGMLGGWAFAQALCGPARLRLPLLPAWSARAAPSLAAGAGAVLVVFWVATGHWLTNDLLAGALCLFMLRALHLPSVRVGTLLFVGLLVYDIFWVFFSDRIFANNVMVAVATRESANPVNAAAERLSLPMPQLPSLSLPAKLLIPSPSSHYEYSMLGLGDVIVPGLLISWLPTPIHTSPKHTQPISFAIAHST